MDVMIYFFIFVSEALIFFLYSSKLFIMKYSRGKTILSISVGYFFMFLVSFFHNATLNVTVFTGILFLLILLMFSVHFSQALFHTIILSSTMSLSEVIVTNVLSKYISTIWIDWEQWTHDSIFILLAFLSKLLYLLITQFFAFVLNRRKSQRTFLNPETVIIIIISICTLATVHILSRLVWTLPHSDTLESTIAFGATLMFIILILVYILYGYNQKKSGEFTDLQLQLQKAKDTAEYYHMFIAQDEKQKIMIHDIKNHLYSLAQLNQNGNQQQIKQYLDELIHSESFKPSMRICDHELLNAILCRYRIQCQEKKIDFHADIRSGCASFLTDEEITALFCNLLDNAVEALENAPNSFIEVSMSKHPKPAQTTLVIKNSCPTVPRYGSAGQFLTNKSNPKYHGYGLRSVKHIVANHHGHMQTYYDKADSTFHVILSLSQK